MLHKRQLITCIASISCFFLLGDNIYADEVVTSNSSIITTSITSNSSTSSTSSKTVGSSGYSITVSKETAFTALDGLVSVIVPDCPEVVRKLLVGLVVEVISGDEGITLVTFTDDFCNILTDNGYVVTDDMRDKIKEYALTYLDEEFEQNNTDNMLSGIYTTLGFISGLLILIWIGGARI